MRKVSEGIGEKDCAEKAHDIAGPGAKRSDSTAVIAFMAKEARHESNQQDNKRNRDERRCRMLKQV
jgi:hypothetical protein